MRIPLFSANACKWPLHCVKFFKSIAFILRKNAMKTQQVVTFIQRLMTSTSVQHIRIFTGASGQQLLTAEVLDNLL